MARKSNGGPPTPMEQVREFLEDVIELFPEVQKGDLDEAEDTEKKIDKEGTPPTTDEGKE